MNDQQIAALQSAFRSLLIGFGSFAVGKGWLSDGALQQIIAGVVLLIPAAWGIYNGIKNPPKKEG